MSDQYRQAFREEARDLLAELESALLALDSNPDDGEVIARAFRALHTIKGSGAMFGFDEIAGFAHSLETAFDRLRKGEIAASRGLINLALAASDQIKAMLDASGGGGAPDGGRSAAILEELRELTGGEEAPGRKQAAEKPPPIPVSEGAASKWRIRFRPRADVMMNGTNPLLLLRELAAMGQMRLTVDASDVPPLREMDPERCYLAWEIELETAAGRDAVRDVFIFIEADSQLEIEPERAAAPAGGSPAGRQSGPAPAASSSIRVSAEKLDQLVNLVGELVTVQARLSELAGLRRDPEVLEISESIDRLTTALRENSMGIRMLPLRSTFERFRRLVRDLAIELHKEAELRIDGADTELDKTVIDQLNDPLVHLIRNAMDHGIEPSSQRAQAGKPPAATIRLSAEHSGAHVLIKVSDDGRGVDAEAVKARAIQQGLIANADRLTQQEILSLILMPGFSTARQVSGISGRGVGMDVVRRSIEGLRGTVEISSQPGAGMTVTLRLPLTLAIIDGILVRVGGSHFVLPLANSLECIELTREDIAQAHGRHIVNVRGELIPYLRLGEFFGLATEASGREQVMVVETEYGRYGFVVDQVLGGHQTVIKNLGRLYRNVHAVSGATILGNGRVALILDPHRLVQSAIQSMSQSGRLEKRRSRTPGEAVTHIPIVRKGNSSDATELKRQEQTGEFR